MFIVFKHFNFFCVFCFVSQAHDTALQLALKRQKHKAAQQKNRADEDAAAAVDNEKKTEN